MTEVKITGLSKSFDQGQVVAIDELDLVVEDGELLVLLGPSGCGKTTLLRCLAGLEHADAGMIEYANTVMFSQEHDIDIPTHKRPIGMVFQNYALWPHMTVRANVAYPLKARGVSRSEQRERALKTLALVECEMLENRLPAAISGGQQQRIALARALVAEPPLILFDEPLSNLDYRLRAQLRHEIRGLHQKLRFTGVYVTHDQTEAMQLGTRVVVLREGRVEQVDAPERLFARPATSYVARFLGLTNELEVHRTADGWSAEGEDVRIAIPSMEADKCVVFLRPGAIELSEPAAGVSGDGFSATGHVTDVIFGGDQCEWIVNIGQAHVNVAATPGTWPFGPGDEVQIHCPASGTLVYENDDIGKLIDT